MISGGRDSIYEALFTRLKSKIGTAIVKYERQPFIPMQLTPELHPALALSVGPQHPRNDNPRVPTVWSLGALIHIYARKTADNLAETVLDGLVDQVEQALTAQPTEMSRNWMTTLGGALSELSIESVEIFPGLSTDQAIAVVTLVMELPAVARTI
jgi:hypothetical protein